MGGWIASRPKRVQALMRQFPPVCRVMALRPLRCPAPGEVARVVSYLEEGPDVFLTVMREVDWFTDGGVRATCRPEWLRVIQYDGNKDPEWVAQGIASGIDQIAENPGLTGAIVGAVPGAPWAESVAPTGAGPSVRLTCRTCHRKHAWTLGPKPFPAECPSCIHA